MSIFILFFLCEYYEKNCTKLLSLLYNLHEIHLYQIVKASPITLRVV
jgi:hypothetical protein